MFHVVPFLSSQVSSHEPMISTSVEFTYNKWVWRSKIVHFYVLALCQDERWILWMCREYIKPKFPTVSLNVWIQIFSFCSGAHKMYVRYSKVMETTHMVEWCLGTPHSLNLGTYLHVALNQAATSCIALVIYTHEST